MDKETAVAIEKLKAALAENDKALNRIESTYESWNQVIKNTIIKTLSWFVGVGTLGVIYGWHLPENVRKAITEWMSK